jgi:hypothetical protein
MLSQTNSSNLNQCASPSIRPEGRYDRNEKDDMKIAIDALYEFKSKLDTLHPGCTYLIEKMLINRPY